MLAIWHPFSWLESVRLLVPDLPPVGGLLNSGGY